ncbi:MAG: type II toxin-antitoxin system VapC family toxin [bacterium]
MRLLLDTHALVWALADPGKLSSRARSAISNARSDVYVSMASAWELSILQGLDRVRLEAPLDVVFSEALAALRIRLLPIQLQHVAAVATLPRHQYGVPVVW